MTQIESAPIVALVSDLIFQSKITGVAAHLGIRVQIVRSSPAALAAVSGAAGMLVDLSANEAETIDLITHVRQGNPFLPIVGFFPHVEADLARRARAAGATRVLPRSQFTENLAEILLEMASRRPGPAPADASPGASRITEQ
jgi:CheY-like chemotaxis protein